MWKEPWGNDTDFEYQIPHGLVWDWTWALAIWGQQLTAWTMAEPKIWFLSTWLHGVISQCLTETESFRTLFSVCLFSDSGVHGALVVLEPSFNGDTMATALGIPPSKNIIRRHLATELEALVLPARYVIFCQMEEYQAEVNRAVNNVKQITSR